MFSCRMRKLLISRCNPAANIINILVFRNNRRLIMPIRNGKNGSNDVQKEIFLTFRSFYETTVSKITDPILLTVLAIGILLSFSAVVTLFIEGDLPKTVVQTMLILGTTVLVFGLIKFSISVISDNSKERALAQLKSLLRPAKSVRPRDITQEMGLIIHESSSQPFIIEMAERIAGNALRKAGLGKKVPKFAALYRKHNSHSVAQEAIAVVQATLDEVSWKRHRVYQDVQAKDQILQFPSTMLLVDEIFGGCSDKVVLFCTLLKALGFPVRFRTAITRTENWMHVWAEVNLPEREEECNWLSVDPSRQGFRLGDKWDDYWNKYFIPHGFSSSGEGEIYECG